MNGTVTKYQIRTFQRDAFDRGEYNYVESIEIDVAGDNAAYIAKAEANQLLENSVGEVIATIYIGQRDVDPSNLDQLYWTAIDDYWENPTTGKMELYWGALGEFDYA